MSKATQDNRLLNITTPLGKDYLLIEKLRATEEISQLFEYDVELLYDEEEDDEFQITPIKINQILGQTVSISLTQTDGTERVFTGMVNRISQIGRNRRYSFYTAKIVPHVWKLTQNTQSRIFQHKRVPDILKEVFEGYEIKMQVQSEYKPRNYCVQYQETDFAFASRLMEEEGIYYYFEHTPETVKMVLRDDFKSPENCPNKHEIPTYDEDLDPSEDWESAVKSIQTNYTLQTGRVTTWDYNFQLIKKTLDAEQLSSFDVGGNKDLEIFTYPTGYARKYDGIGKSGGEEPANLNNIFPDIERTAKNRITALDCQYKVLKCISDCCSITPGYRFQLKNHPNKELNVQYIITSAQHVVDQVPSYVAAKEEDEVLAYKNEFNCIPHGAGQPEFRPALKTPKPIIHGSQTAIVVGPPGEEIFTDKYGRVKVQFHWDRERKFNEDSSCWVRVGTMWASKNWGTMFIPRINMEVIVDFMEGDPDQPIITGTVYNQEAMPPYKLPDEKTKMTIKSDSSVGGNGFNELRFEDKKGSEQIFIHGEKDLDVRIKNDRREWTGKDQHLIVKNDRREKIEQDTHLLVERHQIEEIKKDKHLTVGGNETIKIGSGLSINVGSSASVKTTGGHSSEAGGNYYIKGQNVVIEGVMGLTIKGPGGFITLGPSGVAIQGNMVLINSGGAAIGGSPGSTPTPQKPQIADPADDAKPGSKLKLEMASAARKEKRHKEDETKKSWVKIKMVNEAGEPVSGISYKITTPSGRVDSGTLDKEGKAEVKGIDPGSCEITFPDLDQDAWK